MKARRKVLEFMVVTFLFGVAFSFHPFGEDYTTQPVQRSSEIEVAFPVLTIDAAPPVAKRSARAKRK